MQDFSCYLCYFAREIYGMLQLFQCHLQFQQKFYTLSPPLSSYSTFLLPCQSGSLPWDIICSREDFYRLTIGNLSRIIGNCWSTYVSVVVIVAEVQFSRANWWKYAFEQLSLLRTINFLQLTYFIIAYCYLKASQGKKTTTSWQTFGKL